MSKAHEDPFDDEMLPEYDFQDGVRGKHFRAYQQGHTVEIRKADSTTVKVRTRSAEVGRAVSLNEGKLPLRLGRGPG